MAEAVDKAEQIVQLIERSHNLHKQMGELFVGRGIMEIAMACMMIKSVIQDLNPGKWEAAEEVFIVYENYRNQQ